jgi:hypothetical protein
LWEFFYLRIRNESSLEAAADIVCANCGNKSKWAAKAILRA